MHRFTCHVLLGESIHEGGQRHEFCHRLVTINLEKNRFQKYVCFTSPAQASLIAHSRHAYIQNTEYRYRKENAATVDYGIAASILMPKGNPNARRPCTCKDFPTIKRKRTCPDSGGGEPYVIKHLDRVVQRRESRYALLSIDTNKL